MKSNLKAYVLIKNWVDNGHAANTCFHAGAMLTKHFPVIYSGLGEEFESEISVDEVMKEWWDKSFRKVTCSVSEEEFERAKKYEDWFAVTEMAFLDDLQLLRWLF
jgi:hypothetical protein